MTEFRPDAADLASTIDAHTAAGDGIGGITMACLVEELVSTGVDQ
ncbi:MAG TPA: hypothetical protein VF065_01675 [Ilumatobacter sp.]